MFVRDRGRYSKDNEMKGRRRAIAKGIAGDSGHIHGVTVLLQQILEFSADGEIIFNQ